MTGVENIKYQWIPNRKCNSCSGDDVVLVKYNSGDRTVECNNCGHFIEHVDTRRLAAIRDEIARHNTALNNKMLSRREEDAVKSYKYGLSAGNQESQGLGDLSW